jgi:AcrR family transcriptional regulator
MLISSEGAVVKRLSTSRLGPREMPAGQGRPNRRGAARREQILDEAVELFAERGYRGSGLLELAKRLGTSHVLILHHFGTKEGLLRAVVDRREQIMEQLVEQVEGTGIIGLTDIHPPFEPEVLTRLETVLRVENLDAGDPLHDYFVEKIQRTRNVIANEIRTGQERGEIRSDIDPELKAVEIVAFGIGMETQSLLTPSLINREKVHQSFTRALVDDLTRRDAPRGAAKRKAKTKSRSERKPATG